MNSGYFGAQTSEAEGFLRTIAPVDPTTQTALAALVGAVVAGGAVLAWHLSDRQARTMPQPAPAVDPAVAAVLSVLRSSAVVVDVDDVVLKASAPAYAFGLVKGAELRSEELADLVRRVRRDGQIREAEIVVVRPQLPPRSLTARVAPLGPHQVLALVEDRTRERRVDATRRDFVANVSHELKTPVGAIRLLAEAVTEAADDPVAVKRFSGRMIVESQRLTRLVQQIIELSRLQGDDPPESPRSVSVDQAIATAVDISAIDAINLGVTLVTAGHQDLEIIGSREQVTVAISNLVANAVAYSRPDTSVVVSAKALESTVEISVVDQGIGIPVEEVGRIFERFYRVDPARHRSTGGTGLGLSIVKHVAATHGGEVKVWSAQGQGSTFTLSLPRSHSHSDPDEPDRLPEPVSSSNAVKPVVSAGSVESAVSGHREAVEPKARR